MKAEITGAGDELIITLSADDLPGRPTGGHLRAKLPASAGPIADGVLDMLGHAPEPGEPRPVRVVHVRLVRNVTVAETTLVLDSERQVYA